jgi:anaerobic magnesium-protoporphyrin IX monomethyl ester cyclase
MSADSLAMRPRPHVLLVNPPIISRRNARFPLAVLTLSAALDGKYDSTIVDGSVDGDFIDTVLRTIRARQVDALGVTVMGGPQLRPAIELSKAVRARAPSLPIIWGGAFPTNCPQATLNAPYVDYAVRGQGEATFLELLDALLGDATLSSIAGLSWIKNGQVIHNPRRAFSASILARRLPYERLKNPTQYLPHTYLGRRTAGYQAGLGCRFRCTFCGVAAMFHGRLALPTADRLAEDLTYLTTQLGVDGIQFYDHNFFDREVDMVPLLEVLAKFQLPWWCYARSDALANLSERSWELVRRSRLRMAYIGAESPSDWLLHDIRKGTNPDQTLAAIEACRAHGVIPELSFMLAPPQDPEGETERTLDFIHHIKRRWPETEVMIYVYTPLPPPPDSTDAAALRGLHALRDPAGRPIAFPETPDQWAEPQWQAYWCHSSAPWVSERLRQRIRDFTTVLGCRFPTVMDVRAAPAGKAALRLLASWRYRYRRYDHPWELKLCKKMINLRDPRAMSL